MHIIDALSYRIFSKFIRSREDRYYQLQTKIRQAHIPVPVDQYVSNAYLHSLFFGLVIGFLGLWISIKNIKNNNFPAIDQIADVLPKWIQPQTDILLTITIVLLLILITQKIVYYVYTSIPAIKASIRQSSIDQSIPHAITYLYALSRGGMNMLEIFRSLSMHVHIYGAAAEEFNYIVRDMEYFNCDLLTALKNASNRTPSEKFKDFIDGLISITSTGGDTTAFLKSKADQYQSVAVREQKTFLETLGVLAEVYISVFVIGPLFLITILVVLGLIGSGATNIVYMVIYGIIPISTIIYLLILQVISGAHIKSPKLYVTKKRLNVFDDVPTKQLFDDEVKAESKLFKQLEYNRILTRFIDTVSHPLRTIQDNAKYSLVLSIPIGILYFAYITSIRGIYIGNIFPIHFDIGTISAIDDHIIISLFIMLIPFIIFYEMNVRKIRQIEDMLPEFLKRLASINEAGILLVDAIEMIAQSKIGILRDQIERVSKDISWGSSTAAALNKLEFRIRTDITTRIITLIVKASESTSDVRSVLNIAASDADIEKQLKNARSAEMFVYVFIVYIAFFVFLFIAYVLSAFFLPSIPSSAGDAVAGMPMIASFDIAEYTLLLFHAALIQGFCSGLVAGQMGNGNALAGLKHSVIMVIFSYATFTILI